MWWPWRRRESPWPGGGLKAAGISHAQAGLHASECPRAGRNGKRFAARHRPRPPSPPEPTAASGAHPAAAQTRSMAIWNLPSLGSCGIAPPGGAGQLSLTCLFSSLRLDERLRARLNSARRATGKAACRTGAVRLVRAAILIPNGNIDRRSALTERDCAGEPLSNRRLAATPQMCSGLHGCVGGAPKSRFAHPKPPPWPRLPLFHEPSLTWEGPARFHDPPLPPSWPGWSISWIAPRWSPADVPAAGDSRHKGGHLRVHAGQAGHPPAKEPTMCAPSPHTGATSIELMVWR